MSSVGEQIPTLSQQTKITNATSYAFTIPSRRRNAVYNHALVVGTAGLNSTGSFLAILSYRYSTSTVYVETINAASSLTISASISGTTLTIKFSSTAYGGCTCLFF